MPIKYRQLFHCSGRIVGQCGGKAFTRYDVIIRQQTAWCDNKTGRASVSESTLPRIASFNGMSFFYFCIARCCFFFFFSFHGNAGNVFPAFRHRPLRVSSRIARYFVGFVCLRKLLWRFQRTMLLEKKTCLHRPLTRYVKLRGCACARNPGNVFPATDFKGNR